MILCYSFGMATKKSTTKAKPKTRTAKTTKPKAVQTIKAPAKVVVEKSVKRPPKLTDDVNVIRKILAVSTAFYIALAVIAGTYMASATYQLTFGYLTKDELSSKTSTVFGPATRVMHDIELRWVIVTLMLLSAVLPILYLTRLQRAYSERLKGRVLAWRWINFAITGALMVEVTALLSGVQDIATLKLVGGLVALAAAFSWLSERQNADAAKPSWGALNASIVSLVLAGTLIGMHAVNTLLYGMVRSPWYVYALYGVLFVSFCLFVANQINQHRRFRSWKNYIIVERNHLLISFVSKVAFAAVLITGLIK